MNDYENLLSHKQQLKRDISKERLMFVIENLNRKNIKDVRLYLNSSGQLVEVEIGSILYKLKRENVFLEGSDRDALSEIVFKLKSLDIEFLIFDDEGHLVERISG